MKLPKMYRDVKIRFWSLRDGLGENFGVIHDIDTEVERVCRRVRCKGGWKWQLANFDRDCIDDWGLFDDKDVLDSYGSELEFEYV